MGNNQTVSQSKLGQLKPSPQHAFGQMACQDDLMCQNIDSKRSTVDKTVLVCPNAKCLEGTCECGNGCERDPYTGICCSSVEKQGGNTFCIENEYKEVCKVPDQTINGVKVSGQKICDLYTKYNN